MAMEGFPKGSFTLALGGGKILYVLTTSQPLARGVHMPYFAATAGIIPHAAFVRYYRPLSAANSNE